MATGEFNGGKVLGLLHLYVEHEKDCIRTGIRGGKGLESRVEALIFLFQASPFQLLKLENLLR